MKKKTIYVIEWQTCTNFIKIKKELYINSFFLTFNDKKPSIYY